MVFGFRHHWVWDEMIHFLSTEGYTHQPLNKAPCIQISLKRIISQNAWPANKSSVPALLHSIGKAKSLFKGIILCCPIAAVLEPQIQCFHLCTVARAFALLLKTLVQGFWVVFLFCEYQTSGTGSMAC